MKRLKFLFTLILLCSATLGQTAPNILLIGDSLSAAYGMDRKAGWVALLQQHLDQQGYAHQVINASISGETSAGGLSRLDTLLAQQHPEIVVIALGANDGLRGLSLSVLSNNLRQMVKRSQQHGAKVLLIGMRLPPNYGARYNDAFYQTYALLAQQLDIALVPFLLTGIAEKNENFQVDRLHPKASVQPQLLENVWPILQRIVEESKTQ